MEKNLNFNRTLVAMAALVIVFAGIKLAAEIVVPFLLALFIAIICSPVIKAMTQRKVPHGIAIALLFILILIVLPLILMFLKEPLIRKLEEHGEMFPNGFGAFFVEGFFELFEVVLSFITNTMSFLRVGGFVLSHAGMMLVVYTLAEMVGGFGEIIVLILGNVFVMCLEGLIVGIQVLRLEFYEMFSRYYEGNGIPFKTIKED